MITCFTSDIKKNLCVLSNSRNSYSISEKKVGLNGDIKAFSSMWTRKWVLIYSIAFC